jgi:hypothetical protein
MPGVLIVLALASSTRVLSHQATKATAVTPAPVCALDTAQRNALKSKLGASLPLVFTADYSHPIRRVLPIEPAWLNQAGHPFFSGKSLPGQFRTFQIGVLGRRNIRSIRLRFSDFRSEKGVIPGSEARCLSLGGVDIQGKSFQKPLSLKAGHLQPLWCGLSVPTSARGIYRGTAFLTLEPGGTQKIPIQIKVTPGTGDPDDPNALTRLRWLDSTAGQGTSITKPFIPVKVTGRTIRVLGRELKIGSNGLPTSIVSHFAPNNASITRSRKWVLADPIGFSTKHGAISESLTAQQVQIHSTKSEATWSSQGTLGQFKANVNGRLDYTGSGQIAITLVAQRDMKLDDLSLLIPYQANSAKYLMGLNRKGGLRPSSHLWKWDVKRHQDAFWLGDVNAGLMVRLKDTNFHRPLLNIYYSFLPLALPDSWGNHGRGGVRISESGNVVNATAFSGKRSVRKGETLHFIADIYLTPFRTIDTEQQWATRFIHPHPSRDPKPLDDALASADPVHGPNVMNVHQATYYNPYINYPYSPDSFEAFRDFVARAHKVGARARVYYTTREITQNMPELFALHSLNGEIVFPGPGKAAKTLINPKGPAPWLIKNLDSDFVPAWVDHVGGKYAQDDISVITTPDSRWNNFYLEGLKWMVDHAKIDGVYIDDTALDASSLRRARRILSARPHPLIDLHTWNHFNEYAGYANNLNMYMEVLPYLDRLWLGEGFSANDAPWDYWLVEMSGLPFGLMSEMLESPNTIRGLVFGETGRLGWSGDPRSVWKFFDDYGIKGTDMIPFFDPSSPIQTHNKDILATVYKGKDHVIVVLGNWSGHDVDATLTANWNALGLSPSATHTLVPAIEGVQTEGQAIIDQPFTVPANGIVLVLR